MRTFAIAVALLVGSACGSSGGGGDNDGGAAADARVSQTDGSPTDLLLPPANAAFDYQLGAAYPPPAGVIIVSRDRTATPAAGLYNVCYVNGFQIQPDEEQMWLDQYPDLILRDNQGNPVIDTDWNEMLLDVSTAAKRTAIAGIVGDWIAGCATDGFDAVEIDNLDSYSRSGGRLAEADAVAMMRMLADAAHAHQMPVAQKNSTALLGRRSDMATDFAVAEECNRYNECTDYTAVYGDAVLLIEYRRSDFDAGCREFPQLSIVLRDLDLVSNQQAGYVYDGC